MYIVYKTYEEVKEYVELLENEKCSEIAIDIECEMNLHCYGEHLCLVQVYDRKRQILIDPLAFSSKVELVKALKLIFENRKFLKVTYDAQSDAMLLERVYGIKFKSIYDLRPAVFLLEYQKQSLSNVLHFELNVPLISKKKFQTYNWMRRPIDEAAVKYALSDVIYLFKLKDILVKKIYENNLVDQYMLMNLRLQNKEPEQPNPEDVYRKRKGYSKLSRKNKAFYRSVYDIREKYAEKLNRSPNFLMVNDAILELSSRKMNVKAFLEHKVSLKMSAAVRKKMINEIDGIFTGGFEV